MAQEYAKSFYNSATWKRCSKNYIKYQGGLCERCRRNGHATAATCVHHIKPITPENINNPEITLHWTNLMALCNDCHNIVHDRKNLKRYNIEIDGTVSPH